MYQNTAAEFRPELQVKVEEAMSIDDSFIGDAIFPIYPVETRTGFYKRIKRGKGQLLAKAGGTTKANDPLVRAPGTAYREVTRTSEQDSWKTVDRGLKEAMDDVNKQEESRFFDSEVSSAIWLRRNMMISREVRIATVIQDPTVWDKFDTVAGVSYTEAHTDTLNFAADIKNARRILRKRQEACNAFACSLNVWDLITGSKLLREYFFGTAGGNASIDEALIAAKFKLKHVLIGQTSFDTTKPGKDADDDSLQWAWGDDYLWFGNIQEGAPEMGGAGRTFVLDPLTGGQLFVTETYRDEDKRSDILRVREDDDVKVVNENSGILVKVNSLA